MEPELVFTENGAVMLASSGKKLLDMHFKTSSYRNCDEQEILEDFTAAYEENPELAVKWLFYVGDIRHGLGERRLFKTLLPFVIEKHPHLIKYIGEYNRYDALLVLLENPFVNGVAIDYIAATLIKDIADFGANKPITLLAKWMPSINATSERTKMLGKMLARKIFPGNRKLRPDCYRTYRRTLSSLRKYLGVVESKMCADNWSEIEYSAVPSKANLRYADSFMKHDKERRTKYLEDLSNGKTSINAGVLFPHDIVQKYGCGYEVKPVLEEMWKRLPTTMAEGHSMLVIRDGSYSMTSTIQGTSVRPLDIATALTIYFAERSSEAYRNRFITFSHDSKVIDMRDCDTLASKLKKCYNYDDCSNTNLELVFDRILEIAIKNNLKQEDIPDLLIASDMEFDFVAKSIEAHDGRDMTTLFDVVKEKYAKAGYKLPKLVFWSLCSRTNGIPLTTNENGVILLSGFSVHAINMVMSGELDPYKALMKTLMAERYKVITTQTA